MRVLLVDDEPLALERLKVGFEEIAGAEVVGTACDGEEAAEAIRRLVPDLVVLDVQMPAVDGLSLAAELKGDARPEVVFVTAYQHYAPDAFDVEAADYLLKPVRFDRLARAVERARTRRDARAAVEKLGELEALAAAQTSVADQAGARNQATGPAWDSEIWAPTTKGLVRVPVDAVLWIEAAGDYALLHTEGRSYMIRTTMNALQKRLDPAALTRVHRSAFVRLSAVGGVQRLGKGLIALALHDGAVVHVGPNYTAQVLAALKGEPARAAG
jgi:DNA-binding LytR/AlgR family response regulator